MLFSVPHSTRPKKRKGARLTWDPYFWCCSRWRFHLAEVDLCCCQQGPAGSSSGRSGRVSSHWPLPRSCRRWWSRPGSSWPGWFARGGRACSRLSAPFPIARTLGIWRCAGRWQDRCPADGSGNTRGGIRANSRRNTGGADPENLFFFSKSNRRKKIQKMDWRVAIEASSLKRKLALVYNNGGRVVWRFTNKTERKWRENEWNTNSPAICGVWEISLCTSCPQMAAMAVRWRCGLSTSLWTASEMSLALGRNVPSVAWRGMLTPATHRNTAIV